MHLFGTVVVAAALLPSALAANNNTGKYPYSPTTRPTARPVSVSAARLHTSVESAFNSSGAPASTRSTSEMGVAVKSMDASKTPTPSFKTRNEIEATSAVSTFSPTQLSAGTLDAKTQSVGASMTVPNSSESSNSTRYGAATKTVVSTITSCPPSVTDCTVGSVVTAVATAVVSEVVRVSQPSGVVTLSAVAQADVTVTVPDRFVIVGGGAVYFPGLCNACGHYRVVFESPMLLKYRIEASAPAERNTAIVKVNGEYRHLGCSGDECRKVIIGESGVCHIAVCAGDACQKKLVCEHNKQCEFVACTNDCFQVQLCTGTKCTASARPALPPAPAAVRGGSGVSADISAPTEAKAAITGQGRVTGLVNAAAEAHAAAHAAAKASAAAPVECTSKSPAPGPAHPASASAPAPAPSSGSGPGPKEAPVSKHKDAAVLEKTPAPGRKEASGSAPKAAQEAPVPGRKEASDSVPKVASEAPAAPQKIAQVQASPSAAAKVVTSEPSVPKAKAQASGPEPKPVGSKAPGFSAVPQPSSKPQELGSNNGEPQPFAAGAGKLMVGSNLVGALVGMALVF